MWNCIRYIVNDFRKALFLLFLLQTQNCVYSFLYLFNNTMLNLDLAFWITKFVIVIVFLCVVNTKY